MPFNVRQATAALRYEVFAAADIHEQYGKRWVRLDALWRTRRSFQSVTILEFEDTLKANLDRGTARYLFASWNAEVWICSVTQEERREIRHTRTTAPALV